MAVAIGYAPARKPGRTLFTSRQVRKVAIFGSHEASLKDAPWDDDSWEFHGHASARAWYRREMDFYYDLHPPACWTAGGKKSSLYPKWLKVNTVPIYMQRKYPEIPASIEYPKGRILAEFGTPRPYFTNHVSWMIALALAQGVTHIGLFGINYAVMSEYQIQRASCEYWIGRAAERGVQVVLPEQCTLLQDPCLLYGYQSHDVETGKRVPAYTEKRWKTREDIQPIMPGEPGREKVAIPADLKALIELEESEYPRPSWLLGPLPTDKTDGKAEVQG